MNTYNIFVSRMSPDAVVQEYAVEIRPPLAEIAIDGLVRRLTTVSPREGNPPHAEAVDLVRHDSVGTAFLFTPSAGLYSDSLRVGKTFRSYMNPCDLKKDVNYGVYVVEGLYGYED
jgi:hypothetical protein